MGAGGELVVNLAVTGMATTMARIVVVVAAGAGDELIAKVEVA